MLVVGGYVFWRSASHLFRGPVAHLVWSFFVLKKIDPIEPHACRWWSHMLEECSRVRLVRLVGQSPTWRGVWCRRSSMRFNHVGQSPTRSLRCRSAAEVCLTRLVGLSSTFLGFCVGEVRHFLTCGAVSHTLRRRGLRRRSTSRLDSWPES